MTNNTSGVHIDADLAVQVIGSQADTIVELRVQIDNLKAENAELFDAIDMLSETVDSLGDVCDCADDLDEGDEDDQDEPYILGVYRDVERDVWRHVAGGWKAIQKANGEPLALMPTIPWHEIKQYAPFELIEAAV